MNLQSRDQRSNDPHDAPLPNEIYLRRRILVGGLVVLAVILLALGIVGIVKVTGGSDPSEPSTTAAPPPSKTTSTTTETTESIDPSTVKPCVASVLDIKAGVDKPSVTVGGDLNLTMAILNKGTENCKAQVGEISQKYDIYTMDGENRLVWSSRSCQASTDSEEKVLIPGQTVVYSVTWSGTRTNSDGQCSPESPAVAPGTYQLLTWLNETPGNAELFEVVPVESTSSEVASSTD